MTSVFAEGSGAILLNDVVCSGAELRLFDCPASPLGANNCSHSDDAGVRCKLHGDTVIM